MKASSPAADAPTPTTTNDGGFSSGTGSTTVLWSSWSLSETWAASAVDLRPSRGVKWWRRRGGTHGTQSGDGSTERSPRRLFEQTPPAAPAILAESECSEQCARQRGSYLSRIARNIWVCALASSCRQAFSYLPAGIVPFYDRRIVVRESGATVGTLALESPLRERILCRRVPPDRFLIVERQPRPGSIRLLTQHVNGFCLCEVAETAR
jgi:hypothetical protein